jgi:hypothetical protein
MTPTPLPPPFLLRILVTTLGPHNNPGSPHHLMILNLITSTKSFLPSKTTYSQVPRRSWGGVLPATQPTSLLILKTTQ